ncbi:MAG: XRE family transcriptional regulator [Rhodospirillales bacterium]|nr:XRE family transcriptional regulator [Rhodospirillales bacterium]
MQDPKIHLQEVLKHIRQQAGLSLDKAAVKTGVSKAMLGQIERGESSPTVATLWKIATGFEVSLSSFLEPFPEMIKGVTIRTADEIRQQPGNEGMLVAPIFPFDERLGFEFFELTFLPDYSRVAEPHEKGVFEQISVFEGQMEILAEGVWQKLKKGQSIRFPGDQEHGYRNVESKNAVVHCLIFYPRKA